METGKSVEIELNCQLNGAVLSLLLESGITMKLVVDQETALGWADDIIKTYRFNMTKGE